jgi:telomerase protein component 1
MSGTPHDLRKTTIMSTTWKTVRVFISSTFRDMHAERDHLVKVVFPELRDWLAAHRVYLDDIDLRWGVTREEAEHDRVLDVCLRQIDECRPFFLGILGQRYGWVPTRFPTEATHRHGWVQRRTGTSITELEILYGVLNDPGMHASAFFYFRDPRSLEGVPHDLRTEVYEETTLALADKLADLKQRIRTSGLPVLDGYAARWDPRAPDRPSRTIGRLTGLEEFGASGYAMIYGRRSVADLACPMCRWLRRTTPGRPRRICTNDSSNRDCVCTSVRSEFTANC